MKRNTYKSEAEKKARESEAAMSEARGDRERQFWSDRADYWCRESELASGGVKTRRFMDQDAIR